MTRRLMMGSWRSWKTSKPLSSASINIEALPTQHHHGFRISAQLFLLQAQVFA